MSSLHAEQNVQLEALTITSTAIKTDELKSTDAVEVYTQEDIQKAHVQNIYEFLNKETSLSTMPGYGNPFMQKIDMRGYGITDGYQNIVITINGRKLNNLDMVPQLLASISPSSIEKIEIIKSSGIVSAGDGANAGVINITTKKNNDKELSVYVGGGVIDTAFYAGHSDEKLSLALSGEYQKNDGKREINATGDKDENKMGTLAFTLSYLPVESLELRAGASSTRTEVFYASSLTQAQYEEDPTQAGAYSTHQTYDSDALNLGLSFYINDALSLNLDANQESKRSEYISAGSSGPTYYDYRAAHATLEYISDSINIALGYDLQDNDREDKNNDITKKNSAAYLIGELRVGNSTIKAGYRYENISFDSKGGEDKKDTLHGVELGYNYQLDSEKSFFINYAHSYQSADLDRLFKWDTGAFLGYVEPSQAHNYNLGFNYITASNKFKIALYYVDLKNEIYYFKDVLPWWDPASASKNTNIDKSHKYGVDIYEKVLLSQNFNLVLNYNYIQAIIDEEKEGADDYAGNKLPGVSDHNIKATLNFLPSQNSIISVSHAYHSEAYAANDFNNNATQKQDAYNATDISVTYSKDYWEVFAKINNLFDQSNGLWVSDDTIYPINFSRTVLAGFKLRY
jgi:iron complex outermembrane receptor protein